MTQSDRGPWMQCYSGKPYYPFDPRPEDVRLTDLAHHLAMKPRFNGAALAHYSIAEHSVRVSMLLPPGDATVGLLHDATEAYGPDTIRPWKVGLELLGIAALKRLEKLNAKAIGERFQVDLVNLSPEVKHADNVLLATERRDLLAPSELEWGWLPEPLPERIVPWTAHEAGLRFIERYIELTEGLR